MTQPPSPNDSATLREEATRALRAGDKASAEKWIGLIQADRETPQGVRGRADLISTLVCGGS